MPWTCPTGDLTAKKFLGGLLRGITISIKRLTLSEL
jgi:hypothetical protein